MDRFDHERGPEPLGIYGGEMQHCTKCGKVQNAGDIVEVIDGIVIPEEENSQTEKPQEVIGGKIYCFDKVLGSKCAPPQDLNFPSRKICYIPEKK